MALEGPIGERIRIYRLRRGLSQRQLAGLVQRSESWLSQVERGIRSVDKLSVLIDIAKVLHVKVETLSGRPFALAPNGDPELDGLAAIQDALGSYPGLGVTTPRPAKLSDIERLTTEVHLRYQSADYGAATRILPSLIISVDGLVAESRGVERRQALELQSSVYVAAAKLVTKVGNAELAWLTADRAAGAALHAESPALGAAAAYQVACAFLKNDRLDDAETIALITAENLNDDSPAGLSLRGALTLIAAVIAGRRNDRGEAMERLQRAQLLADQLGEDANHGWTAFGPTNVAIHRVSTAAELGDAASAIAQAEYVDVSSLPDGLLSRRAQVHIDMAWAYTQRRADAEAVVNLMEAERIAPQTLRYNVVVRELLREMLKRERRTATPGLRALARRATVLEG
ncbi:helix-turn-helix transcriptional regulator [Pseudonocardia sp.]|uniref:helix-turn-helix domain-containing protein n=1 Tax=Pseudonocardia sp. TaxID=60912 RepID=UPI00262CCFBD|nr:helix-turn-helix transcriptional regulator [Pseudonocardia sp.]